MPIKIGKHELFSPRKRRRQYLKNEKDVPKGNAKQLHAVKYEAL